MYRKATSFAAVAVAAVVAAVPVSAASAATESAAPIAAAAPAATTESVVKNVSAATGPTSIPLVSQAGPIVAKSVIAPLVVVTKDAANVANPLASATAVADTATEAITSLADIPDAVTDALNVAGLPVANVWNVVKVSQGVYTVFYKLLSSVPNAIITGQWGKVPSLLTGAVNDSLTWITTGAAPKADDAAPAAGKAVSAASSSILSLPTFEVPSIVGAVLDVAAIPVKALWTTVQTAQTVYSNFYKLLSSVPNALITGQWGKIPTQIVGAFTNSASAIINLPIKIGQDAGTAVSNLASELSGGSTPVAKDAEVGDQTGPADSVTGEQNKISGKDVAEAGAVSVATAASARAGAAAEAAQGTGTVDEGVVGEAETPEGDTSAAETTQTETTQAPARSESATPTVAATASPNSPDSAATASETKTSEE